MGHAHCLLDQAFFTKQGPIGVHPNENTATVWLRAEELVSIIEKHGNAVHIVEL